MPANSFGGSFAEGLHHFVEACQKFMPANSSADNEVDDDSDGSGRQHHEENTDVRPVPQTTTLDVVSQKGETGRRSVRCHLLLCRIT